MANLIEEYDEKNRIKRYFTLGRGNLAKEEIYDEEGALTTLNQYVWDEQAKKSILCISFSMKDGQKNGVSSWYNRSGEKVKDCVYDHDVLVSGYRFYANGFLLREENFLPDKRTRHGYFKSYYPSAKEIVREEGFYQNGRKKVHLDHYSRQTLVYSRI